jgi:hypothetical protein
MMNEKFVAALAWLLQRPLKWLEGSNLEIFY